MLFELRVALKYFIPRRGSVSTALIFWMSAIVVSLVVWLVLVFLSVTAGIEKNWLSKLTSLYAPLRIAPSDDYYRSYFYQIDHYAADSAYAPKTIGEKMAAIASDPYVALTDAALPQLGSVPHLDSAGLLVDPVKIAIHELDALKKKFTGLVFEDYEISGALLKLELAREGHISYLSQMSYLLSLMDANPHLATLLVPPSEAEKQHAKEFMASVKNEKIQLPRGAETAVLLPKSYRESGVLIGDRGGLSYTNAAAALSQEQRIPIRVAGFYDPGLLSLGSRCLIVPKEITSQIYAAAQTYSPDGTPTNGFFLWPQKTCDVEALRTEIASRFEKAGIGNYWKIASFEQYEFSKDLLQQFRSDRLLFSLIGTMILCVACCNIIALLILLIHDKKREIAILQSMGASSKSIAAIFALCGVAMGLISCLAGSLLALLTLYKLDALIACLSALQGGAPFNPLLFGHNFTHQLSGEALTFVLIATPLLSLLVALLPAFKACKIRPSAVLRSE